MAPERPVIATLAGAGVMTTKGGIVSVELAPLMELAVGIDDIASLVTTLVEAATGVDVEYADADGEA